MYAQVMKAALKLGKGIKAGSSTFARTKTGKRLVKNRGKIAGLTGVSAGLSLGSSIEKNKNNKYLM
ncbi:hypothetical protein [uncultured Mediterranean phage uvMED]|nr:hypothetical protein [uncultured Mediterranean phage uvMED]BAR17748.1 hypothetical protein [uncultured Mediterranean phage uvMED]|tara:strand:- start:1012 stop:1209 length:198 start_codon:yes stop_codon:yes gene_type:complete